MENINDNAALNNDVEKYRNLAALSYVLMPRGDNAHTG